MQAFSPGNWQKGSWRPLEYCDEQIFGGSHALERCTLTSKPWREDKTTIGGTYLRGRDMSRSQKWLHTCFSWNFCPPNCIGSERFNLRIFWFYPLPCSFFIMGNLRVESPSYKLHWKRKLLSSEIYILSRLHCEFWHYHPEKSLILDVGSFCLTNCISNASYCLAKNFKRLLYVWH